MRQLAISGKGGVRIAYLADEQLIEWRTQETGEHVSAGDVYYGRIADVKQGIQSAFVDIGCGQNAYLYVDDTLPGPAMGKGKPSISERVQAGQYVICQVIKEGSERKAPKISLKISLQGRYLVYLPLEEGWSLSRKISASEERQRLEQIISPLLGSGEGVIVRTEAAGVERERLTSELAYLRARWEGVCQQAHAQKTPGRIGGDLDVVEAALRDALAEGLDEVVVEDATTYRQVQAVLDVFASDAQRLLRKHTGKQPLFDELGVEAKLEQALRREVPLGNGGYLVMDRTEAMTVIDVNTGSFTGGGGQQREQAVTATNLEAAKEIARQLRLRDIGGIVIIDFIDMKEPTNKERVLATLKKELARDVAPSTVHGMTALGLVEMTRKRVRASLAERLTEPCAACQGRGRVLRAEESIRRLHTELAGLARSQQAEAAVVELSARLFPLVDDEEAAAEQSWPLRIYKREEPRLAPDSYRITYVGQAAEAERLSESNRKRT
ncbi:Rne/Rng family ribonuclease [Brevibacillus sp. SAFN-007a]|uniref:Rne/Rng family ribonuclease n=1 Tax=Brevibacillus sp. SAFN-007a TaxID=3436862 RepID=UPI003F80E2C3